MEDSLEINVKLNGVDTPLHKISEQTLLKILKILKIREASKPEPVPAFQVCDCNYNCQFPPTCKRLVLKVTPGLVIATNKYIEGGFVFLDEDGHVTGDGETIGDANNPDGTMYGNFRELQLEDL